MKLRTPQWAIAAIAAFGLGQGFAAYEGRVVDAGGIPGQNNAISTATLRAYVPLLQQRALAVIEPDGAVSRMELDIRPTNVGYSAATGRLFVLGMFDNAVVVVDEATGARTRLALGNYPDRILADDVRGKVYVSNWGGITADGGLSIIDARTLTVRTQRVAGGVSGMEQDSTTGNLFLTYSAAQGERRTSLLALDSEGRFIGSDIIGYAGYSLAVDSRSGRVYVAGVSEFPMRESMHRIFRVYQVEAGRLGMVREHLWPSGPDFYKLNFAVDPSQPGLYFSSGGSTTMYRVDSEGLNLRMWELPLGETQINDGRIVPNGMFGLRGDPLTGNVIIASPPGEFVAEFDPRTGSVEKTSVNGNGFSDVRFWPDSSRLLVTNAQPLILERSAP